MKKCILWGNWASKRSRKGLEKVSARPWPLKKQFFNLHFKCQQNNNLSVFNVQIIRLYSLGSWNVYVPDNFKIYASTEVSTTTLTVTEQRNKNAILPWGTLRAVLSTDAWFTVTLTGVIASIVQGVIGWTGAGDTTRTWQGNNNNNIMLECKIKFV